jgi:hypothetical protein
MCSPKDAQPSRRAQHGKGTILEREGDPPACVKVRLADTGADDSESWVRPLPGSYIAAVVEIRCSRSLM